LASSFVPSAQPVRNPLISLVAFVVLVVKKNKYLSLSLSLSL